MKIYFRILLLFIFCTFSIIAQAQEKGQLDLKNCSLFDAVYKPHEAYAKRDINFSLIFDKPYKEGWAIDFYFMAYKKEEKVSSWRFSAYSIVSPGYKAFDFIALRQDFSPVDRIDKVTPYAFILHNTQNLNLSIEKAKKDAREPQDLALTSPGEDLDDLILHNRNNILPDFRGLNIWVFNNCKKHI